MTIKTVAILSPGEMGAAVGQALSENGFKIVTSLEGRSTPTKERAEAAGFRDAGSLDAMLGEERHKLVLVDRARHVFVHGREQPLQLLP